MPISKRKALNLAFDLLPFAPQPFEKKHVLAVQKASVNRFSTHDAKLSEAPA